MKSTDWVRLYVVVDGNFIMGRMPLKLANDFMQSWYVARDHMMGTCPDENCLAKSKEWLSKGTYSANIRMDDDGVASVMMIAIEKIIGMYIIPDEPSVQERAARAMEENIKIMKDQTREGNEWKGEDE